jgi:hypothetical protein
MANENERRREEIEPLAKHTGRDSANPRNQPGEFADDLATNRFERNGEEDPSRETER